MKPEDMSPWAAPHYRQINGIFQRICSLKRSLSRLRTAVGDEMGAEVLILEDRCSDIGHEVRSLVQDITHSEIKQRADAEKKAGLARLRDSKE